MTDLTALKQHPHYRRVVDKVKSYIVVYIFFWVILVMNIVAFFTDIIPFLFSVLLTALLAGITLLFFSTDSDISDLLPWRWSSLQYHHRIVQKLKDEIIFVTSFFDVGDEVFSDYQSASAKILSALETRMLEILTLESCGLNQLVVTKRAIDEIKAAINNLLYIGVLASKEKDLRADNEAYYRFLSDRVRAKQSS